MVSAHTNPTAPSLDLVCPAGSLPALKAAVDNGANCVYLGLRDATNKWPGETQREWGRAMTMNPGVQKRMNALVDSLGL